jgi:hypothetical protein
LDRWYRAVGSFARIAHNSDAETLLELLGSITYSQSDELELELKAAAQGALVARLIKLGDPNSIPVILAHRLCEFVTADGLASLGPDAIPPLINALDSEYLNADKALMALVGMGRKVTPVLHQEAAIFPSARGSRCAIALCLRGAPDVSHLPPVVLAIERSWSTALAIEALFQIAGQNSTPELRRAIPVLRRLTRKWQMAGKIGLKRPLLPRCLELLAEIDRQTAEMSSMPIISSSNPDWSGQFPVTVEEALDQPADDPDDP